VTQNNFTFTKTIVESTFEKIEPEILTSTVEFKKEVITDSVYPQSFDIVEEVVNTTTIKQVSGPESDVQAYANYDYSTYVSVPEGTNFTATGAVETYSSF